MNLESLKATHGYVLALGKLFQEQNVSDAVFSQLSDVLICVQAGLAISENAQENEKGERADLAKFLRDEKISLNLKKTLGRLCREREKSLYEAQLYCYRLEDEHMRGEPELEEYKKVCNQTHQLHDQVRMLLDLQLQIYSSRSIVEK